MRTLMARRRLRTTSTREAAPASSAMMATTTTAAAMLPREMPAVRSAVEPAQHRPAEASPTGFCQNVCCTWCLGPPQAGLHAGSGIR